MLMLFGLTNALATFQRLINDIFHPLLGCIMVTYFDDILVFSKNWKEHLEHVCNVLQLLCTNHLEDKECKSSFSQTFVSYFGFVINHEGFYIDSSKV